MSSNRRLLSACGATLLASGLLTLSQSAHADLLIDLRTQDLLNPKSANVTPGQMLTLDVYAKVTSPTAELNAAIQELQGSFLSATGATNLLGTIAPAGEAPSFPPGQPIVVGIAPFNASGSVPGNQTDLDADTDLDLGHANADTAAGFPFIRSANPNKADSQGAGNVGVVLDATNVEWKIGRISFTASGSATSGQSTNLNFAYRRNASGTIAESTALWFESTGTKTGLNGVLNVGTPVVLTVSIGLPQWNVDADGSWATAGNWIGGVPNSNTALANFLGKITAPHTVALDGAKQVLELHFDNANTYTIAPGSGGTLTVGNGTTGTIEVAQGNHVISAPLALSGAVTKIGTGTLTLSGSSAHAAGSSLDVSAGNLNLNSNSGTAATAGSAAVANLALTVSGNNSKTTLSSGQDLKGLTISTANAGTQGLDLASPAGAGAFNPLHVYAADLVGTRAALNAAVKNAITNAGDGIFDSTLHSGMGIGVATVADAHGDQNVFVRATRVGDLNLDGTTTIADFITLASHFNQPGLWQDGDVNYDGNVTIADFITLASNFNQSYTGETWPISAEDQQLLSAFSASAGAVPEPGTMGLMIAGGLGLLCRRRRRM